MTIAVNTRLLLKDRLEGIGWFTYESLKRITQEHPEHEFLFIFDRPYSDEFVFSENVTPIVLSPQARHPILYKIWFDWRIPGILKKHKADVFVSPDGYLSLRTDVPQLAVMHDLNFEHYPKDLPGVHGRYYRKYFPRFSKVAARIATVSEYSKKDISDLYDIDLVSIDVVYNGVGNKFKPLSQEEISAKRRELTDGKEYFVFVGSLHPRKNIHRLFRAYERFKQASGSDMKLVIVGEKFWWNEEIKEAFENISDQDDVIFCGRLNDDALVQTVGAATAMTFVPYFEGFGIPILEAFCSQIPVITANVTSMPEVAGDAALLVNPFDIDEIAVAMRLIAEDPEKRASMVRMGSTRLEQFSWDRTADLLWKSIEKILPQD